MLHKLQSPYGLCNFHKEERKLKQEKKYNLYLIPLLATIVITPLIVHMYRFDSRLESYSWYNNVSENNDFFLFYKSAFLIVMSVVMLIIIVCLMYKERKKRIKQFEYTNEHWLIGLGVFLFFAVFSTFVSQYRYYGVHGIADQFESVWVVIGYCVIVVYAYYMIRQESHVRIIEVSMLILCMLLGILGAFQFIGMDFWSSSLGKILMVPSRYADMRNTLEFKFAGSDKPVYLTLYNVNYVGVFCILMIPVLAAIIISARNKIYKLVAGIAVVLMVICFVGCGSKTGILIMAFLAVLAVLMYVPGRKKLLAIVAAAILLLILFVGYYVSSGTNLFTMVGESIKPIRNEYAVTDFVMEDQDACLTYNHHKIYFQTDTSTDAGIQFRAWSDENENLTYYQDADGTIHFEDQDFENITVNVYAQVYNLDYVIVIGADGQYYRFTVIDGQYQFVNSLGRIDELVKADATVFTNYDSLASGRGYIWARTIPLLKKTFFVGTGADSFTLAFPQNDYVAKQNAGYGELIITKPHNLYLQIAVQYGVLALLGFLFVYGFYFRQTLVALKSAERSSETIMAKGIMISLIGYCLMGITNDSCVTVAPLSFVLLGLGFAINRMLLTKKD